MSLSKKSEVLHDPKILALIESFGINDASQPSRKISSDHPPLDLLEFLNAEEIDEWPQRLTSEHTLDLSEGPKLWTLDDFMNELSEGAPFGLERLDSMEDRLNQFSDRLDAFASHFSNTSHCSNDSDESMPSRIPDKLFHAPRKEILDKAADFDAVKLHYGRRKSKKDVKQTIEEAAQASRTRNIDFVSFPGFRPKELTELPSQLETPQLLNQVTGIQEFSRGFYKFWKKLFLSEASIAIMQDTFWWFFLENFEHNPSAQDKLFTRIADSYVSLFVSAHPDIRDKFFQVYPRCLAQCVYLTFYQAFPESRDRFTEEFISELSELVSQWMTGVKPPVGQWKLWPWGKLYVLCEDPASDSFGQDHGVALGMRQLSKPTKELTFDLDLTSTVEDVPAPTDGKNDNLSVNITVTDVSGFAAPVETVGLSIDDTSKSPVPLAADKFPVPVAKKSTPVGRGPDFERVMFNTGGRSPLVTHHLFMKHLRDKNSIGKSMKRTELIQLPSEDVTFQDVISKSKKTIRALQLQREKSQAAAFDDIAKFRNEGRTALEVVEHLKQSLTDPLDIKLRSDKVLDQAMEKGLHKPAEYSGTKTSSSKNLVLLDDNPTDD